MTNTADTLSPDCYGRWGHPGSRVCAECDFCTRCARLTIRQTRRDYEAAKRDEGHEEEGTTNG